MHVKVSEHLLDVICTFAKRPNTYLPQQGEDQVFEDGFSFVNIQIKYTFMKRKLKNDVLIIEIILK